jgi:predicted urease superfamily metal-dependent hydrolase
MVPDGVSCLARSDMLMVCHLESTNCNHLLQIYAVADGKKKKKVVMHLTTVLLSAQFAFDAQKAFCFASPFEENVSPSHT